MTTNVLMVGVGGQGIIWASDVLAEVALSSGFDVKKVKYMECLNGVGQLSAI